MTNDEFAKALSNELAYSFKEVCKAFKRFFDDIDTWFAVACKQYPNKKIVHLALHGKTYRIRKKNKDKILRWYKEENKC